MNSGRLEKKIYKAMVSLGQTLREVCDIEREFALDRDYDALEITNRVLVSLKESMRYMASLQKMVREGRLRR